MCRFSAIHLRLTAVSSRSRRASATLILSPFRRRFSSALVQPRLLSSCCTIRQELPIGVMSKDCFAPVTAAKHVIDRARILDAQRSGH